MADGAGGSQPLNDALAMIAPGTKLREGLDRILQAKHGALILVGDGPAVLSVCTGGFLLDAEYSPQRLSELAKMDGAIILAPDASRIARANVHLVPKATIPTSETGTRHRTAERVARSIDVPVIAVSEAMATIAVYRNDLKHTTQSAGWLIDRSSQALSTLQRFRARYDDALSTLTRLEMEDSVSVRDVVAVLQPGELVRRLASGGSVPAQAMIAPSWISATLTIQNGLTAVKSPARNPTTPLSKSIPSSRTRSSSAAMSPQVTGRLGRRSIP